MFESSFSGKMIVLVFVALSALGVVGGQGRALIKASEPSLKPDSKRPDHPGYSNVDDETKTEVIKVWLERVDKKDHFVTRDGSVYLLISEEIFRALPRKKNGLNIRRYVGSTMPNENDVPYITFSNWSRRENSVWMTGTANFVGGNLGGCKERYDWTEKTGWNNAESECFAAAS